MLSSSIVEWASPFKLILCIHLIFFCEFHSRLWCIQLVLATPMTFWLEGCVLTASRRNIEVFGSTCFWSQLSYPSSCNWDRTLAARPREILRSINKLQTQLNKGGLAGFEVSRLCKSMSSCFVLIPRKASISMSSPVEA